MDIYDIRFNVLLSLDTSAITLHNASCIDKMANNIMSSFLYWKQMYEQYNYKLPKLKYCKARRWIVDFEKEAVIQIYVHILFNYINMYDVYDYHANLYDIQFDATNVSFIDVLDVEEVNMYIVTKYQNKCQIDVMEENQDDDNFLICTIGLYKEGYLLMLICPNDRIYEYTISENSLKQIIYNLISRNVTISDFSGHDIDLNKIRFGYDTSSDVSSLSSDEYIYYQN